MKRITSIIKQSVLDLEPYSSARDEYTERTGLFLDANENPYEFAYARYPDPYHRKLKKRISEIRKVQVSNIFLGNGSDEIIDLLIRCTCLPNDRILTLDPSYGMYKVSAAINEIKIDLVPLTSELEVKEDTFFKLLSKKHKLIFICSPNNPNGGTISRNFMKKLIDKASGLVVIDEAYVDFSSEPSFTHWVQDFSNLVVLQTFSKSWASAGLRIGMGFANKSLIGILNKIKPPYNISTPTQELALQQIDNLQEINKSIEAIKQQRQWLREALDQLSIVEKVFPSQANFLLVRFQNATAVMQHLIKNNIIVRNRSLESNCSETLRITVGTTANNLDLIKVLKTYTNG